MEDKPNRITAIADKSFYLGEGHQLIVDWGYDPARSQWSLRYGSWLTNHGWLVLRLK